MEIETKEIDQCKFRVNYSSSFEEILNKRREVMSAFKDAPVPGFRAKKATLDAIAIHYRKQIDESLKRALIEEAYHNTIFEKQFKPHGPPTFNSALLEPTKFTCEFEMHVKPDFELTTYKDFEIPQPHVDENAVELTEKILQELRVKFGILVPYDEKDFVQKGDSVILDYDGFIDGEKVDNLSAIGETVTIGHSKLKAFDDNLYGMSIGETRTFTVIVPPEGLPSLAGKEVKFIVTLQMGSKSQPHALDDELAKKMNKNNLDELRQFVGQTSSAKVAMTVKQSINNAVSAILVKNHDFEVPNWLKLSEAQYLAQQGKADWNTMDERDKNFFLSTAEKNVKLALILDRIREVEPDAQLSDQEIFEIIKEHLAKTKSDVPVDDLLKEMNRTGYLQLLFARIKDEHTLDFIVKTVKFIE